MTQAVAQVDPAEVVLFVSIFNPAKRYQKSQEFVVLGCNRLTELRDKIYCLTDTIEAAESKDITASGTAHGPSSACLFIENVFYSDMRDAAAINYGA